MDKTERGKEVSAARQIKEGYVFRTVRRAHLLLGYNLYLIEENMIRDSLLDGRTVMHTCMGEVF